MERRLDWRLVSESGGAVLCSSDSPTMPAASLARALPALTEGAAVLGPASDGGYWAIGASRFDPALFRAIPWSTTAVASTTRLRLGALGWRWTELAEAYDVDEPADLARLRAELANDPARAPRCARWLREAT